MKEKELERLTKLKEYEQQLYRQGIKNLAGIDEAGRGPLAGPVVVACCILPEDSWIEGVNDSKKITEKRREKLYDIITQEAICWQVGIIGQEEIDELNILNATKKALTTVIDGLSVKPDRILVDAFKYNPECSFVALRISKYSKSLSVLSGLVTKSM